MKMIFMLEKGGEIFSQLRQYRELIGQTRLRKADFETLVKRDPKNDAAKRQWREVCVFCWQREDDSGDKASS